MAAADGRGAHLLLLRRARRGHPAAGRADGLGLQPGRGHARDAPPHLRATGGGGGQPVRAARRAGVVYALSQHGGQPPAP